MAADRESSGGDALLTSLLLAWLAVIFTAFSAVLYIVKRSGNRRLRRLFSRIHIAVGAGLIAAGVAHGVLAGNVFGAAFGDIMVAPLLLTWNWGTACLVASVLLALSYMLRKRLKKRWMKLHRVLTVAMIALVVLHVADVGVQLFDRLAPVAYAQAKAEDALGAEAAMLSDDAAALFSGAALTDGVYQGSAMGYNGAITVSVAVLDGQVADIDILSEKETAAYFRRAETIIDTILDGQSLAVDAVSGATYTSAGIVNAVADALSAAVGTGTLELTEYTYTAKSERHGRHGR